MPTPVGHMLAGVGVYVSCTNGRGIDRPLLLASVGAACFADVDFGLSFLAGENLHHYFTHSLGFAALFTVGAAIVLRLVRRERPSFDTLVLGLAYLSHLGLDLLSKDNAAPYGLELLWPFSDRFVISPVQVFDDIWRGTFPKLFGLHNWIAVGKEIAIVGPPVALLLLWRWHERRRTASQRA
jgi:inner membrane protein